MTDLIALKAANEKRWKNAKLTRGPEFVRYAQKAVANKQRYISICERAGMPDTGAGGPPDVVAGKSGSACMPSEITPKVAADM